ncbi:MAG: rhamnulokinase, partial [Oscillospiraceae bacterium]|nr:rhamnulokinase [Oscillospiraceae bacterium]
PIDATIYGNAALQLLAIGVLADTTHARRIITQSETLQKFTPKTDCFEAYDTFSKILKKTGTL